MAIRRLCRWCGPRIYQDVIVLELKFTGRFPNWFNGLISRFNLMRAAAMKYSGGVVTVGEGIFIVNPVRDEWAAFAVNNGWGD